MFTNNVHNMLVWRVTHILYLLSTFLNTYSEPQQLYDIGPRDTTVIFKIDFSVQNPVSISMVSAIISSRNIAGGILVLPIQGQIQVCDVPISQQIPMQLGGNINKILQPRVKWCKMFVSASIQGYFFVKIPKKEMILHFE